MEKEQKPGFKISPEQKAQVESKIKEAFSLFPQAIEELKRDSARFDEERARINRNIAARGRRTSGRIV